MEFGLQQVLIAIGAILGTWIFYNKKLKDGVTDWMVSWLGTNSYNISDHNVQSTIKSLKFNSKLTNFDNKIKTELYHLYIETVLDEMDRMICKILSNHKTMKFEEIKRLIKNEIYDALSDINKEIDNNILMPEPLQEKFNKFRNYLSKQHTYAIEHALQAPNKKILMIQVFDAIENNSRWFLFYSTEMFENFNGHFDTLSRNQVFIKKN